MGSSAFMLFGLTLLRRPVAVYLDPGRPGLLKSWPLGDQPHDGAYGKGGKMTRFAPIGQE